MANNTHNNFSFNFKDILIDEIALNGLEGIGLGTLWNRVEKRISSPITDKMKARFWKTVVNCEEISFYQNPEPVACVEVVDRFTIIDENTGQLAEPEACLEGEYEYRPVDGEYGSCVHFNTRVPEVRQSLHQISYEQVAGTEYGERLVMVASIEERWRALADHKPISHVAQMTIMHYCILELIGKGRENGQITQGKTNLTKIVKDSKFLFYNRNYLQKLDLIRAQTISQRINNKHSKAILLRLKRFHQPPFFSIPRVGKLRNVIDYLLEKPDYSAKVEVVIENGLITRQECKKLQKTVNVFDFEDRFEASTSSDSKKAAYRKRYMTLNFPSDTESGDSENDAENELPCQYKVGVSLLRQAYELLMEAGLKGLTQIELGQLLGVEFYTSRSICKLLKANHIVREFLEDKGKQRTARFIAVTATREMDGKYEAEKNKFLSYMSETKTLDDAESRSASKRTSPDHDSDVPTKKLKQEEDDTFEEDTKGETAYIVPDINVIEREVTEVKVQKGLENYKANSILESKKTPTLRQLRFANGMLKVLRERLAVSGYCTLSALVAKEINEPPLDAKRLKLFVQKLITDGQVKILKMKWPGPTQNYTNLFCAPHVKPTDPVIVTKYRELCLRAVKFKKCKQGTKVKAESAPEPKFFPVFMHTYPKYMKIQKLHEFLMKAVYFDKDSTEPTDTPEGFSSLVYILPELTVEFAMSIIKHADLVETHGKIDKEYYSLKLKDTPDAVNNLILKSSGFHENIKYNLRILGVLGLIQLIKEPNQVGENVIAVYSFYVNRNAKILDTTGAWPRQVDEKSLERSYQFETFKDVERYWQDVYNISTKTVIQLEKKDRQRKSFQPPLRLRHEVQAHDKGERFGDGLGPCGFDATFFMEAPRFWSTFYCNLKKKHQLELKQPIIRLPKKEKKARAKPLKNPKGARRRAPRVLKAPPPKVAGVRPRAPRMSSAVKWTEIEDKIVMLSKAAITIMSPVSQPGSLRIRNTVARDILTMNDPKKYASVCHVRAQIVEADATLAYEKECLINELRHREGLMRKYDGVLNKIRVRHAGNLTKLIQEARLPMLELMWVLYQISKSESFNRRTPCVALSLQDFYTNFTIYPASASKAMNLYHTPRESDPSLAALKEGMVLTVLLSFQNELTSEVAEKIYEMFNEHPESTLRTVIEHLRKCGAVAAREKILNNMLSKVYLQEIVQSSYKLSAGYQRKWLCRLNSDFVDKLRSCLDSEVEPPVSGVRGTPELNCFLSEMHASHALDITSVTVPVITGSSGSIVQDEQLTVGDIFMKFNLKSGTCGWTPRLNAKTFAELFQDIVFGDSLDVLGRNSAIDVVELESSAKSCQDEAIVSHLQEKKEAGSRFPELQKVTGYDSKLLSDKLKELAAANVIKRVGYYENIIILTKHLAAWTLRDGDKHIIPTPWLTLVDDEIRRDIFLKWAAVIVNTVFKHPGCSLRYLSHKCEFLTTRSAQDLSMTLETYGCVKLNVLKDTESDWWSEDDVAPSLEDFNEYELVENIVVFPVKDSLTRFAYVRSKILEEHVKK